MHQPLLLDFVTNSEKKKKKRIFLEKMWMAKLESSLEPR